VLRPWLLPPGLVNRPPLRDEQTKTNE